MLTALRKSTHGGRLIISEDSIPLANQLLVFGEPEFFTRWEIISAKHISEAMIAATEQSSPRHTQASALFDSIRQLSLRKNTTQLAVDYDIRNKLDNILKLEPRHVSAASLVLQGSGRRPMHLSEQALALELLPVVSVLSEIVTRHSNPMQLDEALLRSAHKRMREQLDPMAVIVDRSNDAFYQEAMKLANGLRDLMRLIKRNESSKANDYSEQRMITMYEEMINQSADLISRMTDAAGLKKEPDAGQ